MSYMKSLGRIAFPALIGITLLSSGGCGGETLKLDPAQGEKIKEARIKAMGPSGNQIANGPSGAAPAMSPQEAARRKAMGGR